MKILVAIDDTDNETSIGTGRLSRMLAARLTEANLAAAARVTRHQLLVHPDIPYTSHNSSACIEADLRASKVEDVAAFAREFLLENFHDGANPGLCVSEKGRVPHELFLLGRRAQKEVLELEDSRALARRLNVSAWWHGETGQGCIGAMAAVGLRSEGNDGRFIELEGIRDVEGSLTVCDLLNRTGIDSVVDAEGAPLKGEDVIESGGWLRPSLVRHRAVLQVARAGDAWRPVGKKMRES